MRNLMKTVVFTQDCWEVGTSENLSFPIQKPSKNMPAMQIILFTLQISEYIKKWFKMTPIGFPLTPVTKIHGWHRSDLQIDQSHLEPLEKLEMTLNLMRIPMPSHDPKISDTGTQMPPKASKMTPQSDPKTRNVDFQKRLFYHCKNLLFEVTTPSKPTKETSQIICSVFWHHETKKWVSWLQSASQRAPPGDQKLMEFNQKST